MKKLMILLFILATVNIANAGIVDIVISSLNGQPITPVKEITIFPTDTINFDVTYQDGDLWSLFSLSTEIVKEGSPATFDISQITWPDGYWNMDLSDVTMLPNGNILLDTAASDIGTVPAGIVLDHFLMHCDGIDEANPDVYIYLVYNPNTKAGLALEFFDDLYEVSYGPGVVVHQIIPEPMTLSLLGLGGLFALRRKKK